jgi:Fe-S-cluster containining protein
MLDILCNWWQKFHPGQPGRQRGCRACGYCCELFGGYLHASTADLERWRQLGREDLLALVGPSDWIWIDPQNGRRGAPCPFLQRTESQEARCAIHEVKPDMCRDYPTMDHGRHCVRGIYIPRPAKEENSPPH